MKFNSLSEAIKYYAFTPNVLKDLSPYSEISYQVGKSPQNSLYVTPSSENVVTYGKSVWGIGMITDIDKPRV